MKFQTQHKKSTWFLGGCAFLLLAIIMPGAAAYQVTPVIHSGATVYIGEEGLNVTRALNGAMYGAGWPCRVLVDEANLSSYSPPLTEIGWWASAGDLYNSAPSRTINLSTSYKNLMVAPSDFVGYTGNWYLVGPDGTAMKLDPAIGLICTSQVFSVQDPALDIRVWDFDQNTDVTSGSVKRGDSLGFRISTTMYGAISDASGTPYRFPVTYSGDDGYIDIHVMNESGYTYTQLSDNLNTPHSLLRQNVSASSWTWGDSQNPTSPSPWATGVIDSWGRPVYPEGTYTVWAESHLNNITANYKQGGALYTGKTVSPVYTITILPDTVTLEVNKGSVSRGELFAVTISGTPSTLYYLWVRDTSSLTGGPNNEPPIISLHQEGVTIDPATGPYSIGSYEYENGAGNTLRDDVSLYPDNGVRNYARIKTSSAGTRTIEFQTDSLTRNMTYTIRVENLTGDIYKSAEATITVERDIAASKIGIYQDGSWYIDLNGDGVWNGGDQNYGFGAPLWTPVTGDWNHDGNTEIGVYRDGAWYLDYDASGWWSAGDKNFGYGAPGWTPVVGDWNGDGSDKAGAYKDGAWYLDFDGSGTWNAGDKNFAFGGAGWEPVIGKWTADGKSKVGVYKDGVYYIDYTGDNTYGAGDRTIVYGTIGSAAITGDWNADSLTEVGTKTGKSWHLDYDGLGAVNASTKSSTFGAAGWDPVIGDWNGDSPDKIGIYLNGAWYLDYNGNGVWDAGTDKNYAFGTAGWIPVVGKW